MTVFEWLFRHLPTLRVGVLRYVLGQLALVFALKAPVLAQGSAGEPQPGWRVALGPLSPQLRQRIGSYIRGSSWSATLVVESALPAALVEARRREADVLVLVEDSPEQLRLRIVDLAARTTARRTILIQQGDPLARSAAYETVALVISATLRAVEQGQSIAEPSPPEAALVLEQPPPQPREPEATQGVPSPASRLLVDLGWRGALDGSRVHHGPTLGAGFAVDPFWLAVSGELRWPRGLVSQVPTEEGQNVRFEVSSLSLGLTVGGRWVLPTRWETGFALGPALTWIHRERAQVSDALAAAPEQVTLAPQVQVLTEVSTPPVLVPNLRLVGNVGVSVFLRRPRWRLSTGEVLSETWQELQPWLTGSFRLAW